MDLSLSIIANYLPQYLIERHITESDRFVSYKRPRLNRKDQHIYIVKVDKLSKIYIYGDFPSSYVIYNSTNKDSVMEKVLNIYEKFDDYYNQFYDYLYNNDYNGIIDIFYNMFHNPCYINNSQNRVLGLSKKVDSDSLQNPEWEYLNKFGYSTLRALNKYKRMFQPLMNSDTTMPILYRNQANPDHAGILSSHLTSHGHSYGRILVMEYYRRLNYGDIHLLNIFSSFIANHMYNQNYSHGCQGNSILSLGLENKGLGVNDCENLIFEYGWKEYDAFRVIVIEYRGGNKEDSLSLVTDYCENLFIGCPVSTYENNIVILLNESIFSIEDMENRIRHSWLQNLYVNVGISLEFRLLNKIYHYFQQSLYANNMNTTSNLSINYFYKYGFEYVLNATNSKQKNCAMHPDVTRMIRNDMTEYLECLYVYLLEDRSPQKTADFLHIHKNTLLYRLNKIKDSMKYDIEDTYNRQYILASLMIYYSSKDESKVK